MYAQIVVNVPSVAGVFDYAIPEELAEGLGIGKLVVVPFGRQKVQGLILRFVDQPSVAQTKDILELIDPDPVLTSTQIALAEWMAEATLSPLAAIVNMMVPSGLSQQADVIYEIRESGVGNQVNEKNPNSQFPIPDLSPTQSRLLNLLTERSPLRGRQIDTHFRNVDWRKSADWLVRQGILEKRSVLMPPRVRPKNVRVAQFATSIETANAEMQELGSTEATQTRRAAALRYLMRELDEVNVSWVYAESGCNLSDLRVLAERGLIVLRESEIWRDPLEKIERRQTQDVIIPKLTPAQEQAWEKIYQDFSQSTHQLFLLHGVTGSGKTELYIRAAEEAVRRGQQAIILVPEIALTPQTVRRFLARFPGQVGLIHSKLYLAQGAQRAVESGHRSAQRPVCAPAQYRPDRGRRMPRWLLLPVRATLLSRRGCSQGLRSIEWCCLHAGLSYAQHRPALGGSEREQSETGLAQAYCLRAGGQSAPTLGPAACFHY